MSTFTYFDDRWKISECEKRVYFVGSPFSQWYMRDFEATTPFNTRSGDVEVLTFNCAEQYMMAGKALQAGDYDTFDRIMVSKSPKEQKTLGREVQGYDDAAWTSVRESVVRQGNMAKWSDPTMKAFLLSKGKKEFVEGAWYDNVWGVKLSWSDPLILDPANWQGLNLLGKVLNDVRDFYAAEVEGQLRKSF